MRITLSVTDSPANSRCGIRYSRDRRTLLLSDDWTEASFNTQQWFVNDPGDQFNLGDGALNVVSSFALPLGQSYIQMNNGLELAGGIDLEHGEFGFNDYSVGIIGGLYTQSLDTNAPYSSGNCLGGFYISSPSGVVTSASGAAGVVMQPTWMGQPIGPPIVSQVNHTYVLQTVVTSPKYVRYNRWYRSLGGNSYGGVETQVSGNITFIVQDFDIAAATGFYYQPKHYEGFYRCNRFARILSVCVDGECATEFDRELYNAGFDGARIAFGIRGTEWFVDADGIGIADAAVFC